MSAFENSRDKAGGLAGGRGKAHRPGLSSSRWLGRALKGKTSTNKIHVLILWFHINSLNKLSASYRHSCGGKGDACTRVECLWETLVDSKCGGREKASWQVEWQSENWPMSCSGHGMRDGVSSSPYPAVPSLYSCMSCESLHVCVSCEARHSLTAFKKIFF